MKKIHVKFPTEEIANAILYGGKVWGGGASVHSTHHADGEGMTFFVCRGPDEYGGRQEDLTFDNAFAAARAYLNEVSLGGVAITIEEHE